MPLSETQMQVQVVEWLYSLHSEKFEFFATLNESSLASSAGKSLQHRMSIINKAKKMGLKTGIPDLVFLCDGGYVFFIEMKNETGILNKNQKFRIPILKALGFNVHVCRSLNEVKDAMRMEGII